MCSFPRTLSLLAGSVTIAIQQELRCVIFCLTSTEVELSQGPTLPLVLHTNDHILPLLSYTGALLQALQLRACRGTWKRENSIVKKVLIGNTQWSPAASLLRGAIWRRWKAEGGSYSTNMCQPPTSQLSAPLIHLLSDSQWEFCENRSLLSTLACTWSITIFYKSSILQFCLCFKNIDPFIFDPQYG